MHIVARAALVAVAGALPAVSPLAAQRGSHPDPTGVWKMDTTKFEKHDAALAGLSLTVSRSGDTLVVVTDVQDAGRAPFQMQARYLPSTLVAVAAVDSAHRVSPFTWDGDTLVLHTIERRPQRTLDITERWAIDASGRTLSRLQTVLDGPRVSRQTLVFTKQ